MLPVGRSAHSFVCVLGLQVLLVLLTLKSVDLLPLPALQALANNLLARAVQLSRHDTVGPDAAVCCALAVAELQLQQARAMLGKGGAMRSLAAALLDGSYQQLAAPDLQMAATGSAANRAALQDAKKQVG